MALIDDEPRSAHVIAMEDSTLFVLRREDFQASSKVHPASGSRCCASCRGGCAAWMKKSAALSCSTCTDALPTAARSRRRNGRQRITRRLTHHTIAQMIGSSRETVSRTMRELVDKD